MSLNASFEGTDLSEDLIANPAAIQALTLAAYTAKLESELGDTVLIANANNGFVASLDITSTWVAQCGKIAVNVGEKNLATRATTLGELARHFSDQDYLNITASPSTTTLAMLLNAAQLRNKALYDGSVQKIVIPRTSTFTFGSRTFGLYYPIEIKISSSGSFSASYDETDVNPLYSLSTNIIPTYQYTSNGIDMVRLEFTGYQFSRAEYNYSTISLIGFKAKGIAFDDQFYACRVWHYNDTTAAYEELEITLTDDAHDRSVPTAKITVSDSTIDVEIPYIYFSQGDIGSKVKVEIYSTIGALDETMTTTDVSNKSMFFDLDNAGDYSQVLSNMTYLTVAPVGGVISGGSDGMTFDEAKTAYVAGEFYDTAPITIAQRKNHLAKKGFTYSSYIDNVTNRTSFALKQMSGGSMGPIPVVNGQFPFKSSAAATTSTVLSFPSYSAYTVLPTTVYRYGVSAGTFEMLTDAELAAIAAMDQASVVAMMNSKSAVYTRYPFHLAIYADDKYPQAKSFNLTPSIEKLRLISENNLSLYGAQVVITSATHLADGTGGYKITLGVTLSANLASVDRSLLYVLLTTIDSAGNIAYLRATYSTTTSVLDVFEVVIPTDYYLSSSGTIRTQLTVEGTPTVVDIDLSATWYVKILLDTSVGPDLSTNDGTILLSVPTEYAGQYAMTNQSLTLTLGTDLSNGLKNTTTVEWTAETYNTYLETTYQTYASDEYLTVDGVLVTSIGADGTVTLTKTHSRGDYYYDDNGDKIPLHVAGDVELDAYGNPIVSTAREAVYSVDMFGIDGRLYWSQTASDVSYVARLPATIAEYVNSVISLKSSVLELVDLFFKPMSTIGTTTFSVGDGVTITTNSALSFSMVVYCTSAVKADTDKKASIKSTIKSTIKAYVAANTVIATTTGIVAAIKTAIGDDIVSLNNFGINGETELQTLICLSDNRPIVAVSLVVLANGTYGLEDDISVEFKLAE